MPRFAMRGLWVTDWSGDVNVFSGGGSPCRDRQESEAHHLAFSPAGDLAWTTMPGECWWSTTTLEILLRGEGPGAALFAFATCGQASTSQLAKLREGSRKGTFHVAVTDPIVRHSAFATALHEPGRT